MDIRNIGGKDGVVRGGDRPQRAESQRDYVIPSVRRDEANISANSRATAAAVDALAERAQQDDPERAAKVAAAAAKLKSGELDSPAVHRATAQQLFDAKFLSA